MYLCGVNGALPLLIAGTLAATLWTAPAGRPSRSDVARRLRVMEWNCENLFDTVHAAGRNDADFTPQGSNAWDTRRYWTKQGHLARVMLEAAELSPIDLIGLCEVEGDSVVRDLTRRTRLAALGYEYVVTDGPDPRGIEVALLYQPATFRLTDHRSLRVAVKEGETPTRDVLTATGVIPTGDTLDVAVVHFPSRRGGAKQSAPRRMRAAEAVRTWLDSLRTVRREMYVLVMGDCNDTPTDGSLCHMAEGGLDILTRQVETPRSVWGSYCYQGEWSQIDNMLLSADAVARFRPSTVQVFAPEYLLETDARAALKPRRTYLGPIYHGGTSDHLPLVLDLWY